MKYLNFLIVSLFILSINNLSGGSFKEWKTFSDEIKKDKRVILYYTFENIKDHTVINEARGNPKDLTYKSENFNGKIYNCQVEKGKGRWKEKSAIILKGYVDCGNDDHFDMKEKSFTVEAWIKTMDKFGGIITKHTGGRNGEWIFGVRWMGKKGVLTFGPSQRYCDGKTNISDNKWHHIAGVMWWNDKEKKGKLQLYVDGELDNALEGVPSIKSGKRHVLCFVDHHNLQFHWASLNFCTA